MDTDPSVNVLTSNVVDHASMEFHPVESRQAPKEGAEALEATVLEDTNIHDTNVIEDTIHEDNNNIQDRPHTDSTTSPDETHHHYAAWAIHASLLFFATLILLVIWLTITSITRYGFLTAFFLLLILLFAAGLAWFVDVSILSRHAKLRPIRQAIGKTVRETLRDVRQAVRDEVEGFREEWKESGWLLEDGDDDDDDRREELVQERVRPKKKSWLFSKIKPLLFRRGRRKRKDKKESTESPYELTNAAGVLA